MHGSKTWPVRTENEVALQQAEMKMVRRMCGFTVKDRVPSRVERLGLPVGDIILVLQQNRLRVLRKGDNNRMKKCIEYGVEVGRPRGRPKRTRTEVVQKDCQARKLMLWIVVDGGSR